MEIYYNVTKNDFVEINGIKWCIANLGANTPSDFGNYYTYENVFRALPNGWRLPKEDEFKSLISIHSIWTNVNGINGRLFGNGSNQLFLPATGFNRYERELRDIGKNGKYWSESDITPGFNFAPTVKVLEFNSDSVSICNTGTYHGRTVRCVKI